MTVDALSLSDRLGDGTEFGAVIPSNWNGTLLLDLDFVEAWQMPNYQALFERGFAGAGTARNYTDPAGGQHIEPWVDRTLSVADRLSAHFTEPRRTISWGVSRGGHVAVAAARLHPERIAGAIPRGIYGGAVSLMNQDLDLMFALKALLAPEDEGLPLVNLSNGPATPNPVGLKPGLAKWNAVVACAETTAKGRARIALAAALAQLPDWVDATVPRPAPRDDGAIADGWLRNVRSRLGPVGTFAFMRPVFETSAGGNFSWNVGTDYGSLLSGRKLDVVVSLYGHAGLDLAEDMEALAAAPRIAPDPDAAWFLDDHSVNFDGDIRVPVLTLMTIGDPLLPVSGIWTLAEAASRAGRADMLRMTFTETVGHCVFSVAEDLAVVDTMMRRLDTGTWGDTSATAMNELARGFGADRSRFIDHDLEPFSRAYVLGDPHPQKVPALVDAGIR